MIISNNSNALSLLKCTARVRIAAKSEQHRVVSFAKLDVSGGTVLHLK